MGDFNNIDDVRQSYVEQVSINTAMVEAKEAVDEMIEMSYKAAEFTASEARTGTQPTDAASIRTKTLIGCARSASTIEGIKDSPEAIEGVLNQARAVFALDPEGLSGNEMREEISRIGAMTREEAAAEVQRLTA